MTSLKDVLNPVGLTADPGSPAEGDMWRRTDLHQLRMYDGDLTKAIVDSCLPMVKTGYWYNAAPVNTTNATGLTMTINTEWAMPMVFGFNGTLSGIACNVSSAGASSNTLRAGIRADSGNCEPASSAPLYDGGTVSSTGTGVKTWSPSLAIVAGRIYWVTLVSQTGTACQVSTNTLGHPLVGDVNATPSVVTPVGVYSQTGVTGALPSTWTTGTTQGQTFKWMVKFSAATR